MLWLGPAVTPFPASKLCALPLDRSRLAPFSGRNLALGLGVRYCQISTLCPFLRSFYATCLPHTPLPHSTTSRAVRGSEGASPLQSDGGSPQDPNRIFLARRINKLGFRAQEAGLGSFSPEPKMGFVRIGEGFLGVDGRALGIFGGILY